MTDRLRVLRVIARMNVGGPAAQAAVLTNGLDASRFEQRLLVGTVGPEEADYLELKAPGIAFRQIGGLGRAPHAFDDTLALAKILAEVRRFRPHIIHTHTAKAGALGRLAAALGRVPARVHTFHGHVLHGYFSPAKTRAIINAERVLARFTTRTVAEGARVRDELVAAGIGQTRQYSVVVPGLDLRPLPTREDARRSLGLRAEAPTVAFVGRLIPVKRPDRFVATAVAVAAEKPSARFLIVGDGELRPENEAAVRAAGAPIQFLGWRADIETIYAAADVVVLTSDNEGMPYSLIEAALAGRPAVTTAAGSAPEVVLDGITGFVTAASSHSLAEAVKRLLRDQPLREQMGVRAAARARHEFSAARLIRDVSQLYEEVAAETRACP